MKKILLPIVFASLGINTKAQEKEISIDELQITSKFLKTPYQKVSENIEVISAKDIEASPAKTIDDLLQQINGFDISRRGANGVQSDVSLRGGSFEQVLIMINGVRMNDSQTGHNSLNIPVDLSNVERIEVIKGPAARKFGQNAYAGLINIITKTSSKESVKISLQAGDFSTWQMGLGATFGTDKVSHLFQINQSESQGYRYNTDSEIRNAFYQNKMKLKNASIGFQAGFQEKKFGANGFYASKNATEQYEETQASVVSVNTEQNFGNLSLNTKLYWRRGQDMYLYIRNKPAVYRNMHIGNNLGGEINGSYKSVLGTTGLGLELRKEFLVSNNLGKRERLITQLFFEHHFSLFENKLQLSPGVSWANYSNTGNFFYPGLDIGFDINEQHKLYGNIAKVHRIPTFTDLYYKSKTELGNENLKPENALSAELGYRFHKNNFIFKLSGFVRKSDNSIDWVRENDKSLWTAKNIGNINTKGIEVEFEHRLNDWLKYSAAYTFIDLEYHNSQNLQSKYALENLKHQFIARMENRFFKNFTNEIVYRYQERATSGSYQLLDEKLSYTKDKFNFYILINNLTNVKYTEAFGVPMPERWFNVGVSYKIDY